MEGIAETVVKRNLAVLLKRCKERCRDLLQINSESLLVLEAHQAKGRRAVELEKRKREDRMKDIRKISIGFRGIKGRVGVLYGLTKAISLIKQPQLPKESGDDGFLANQGRGYPLVDLEGMIHFRKAKFRADSDPKEGERKLQSHKSSHLYLVQQIL